MISCNVIERAGFLERVNEKAYSFVFIQIVKIPSNELHGRGGGLFPKNFERRFVHILHLNYLHKANGRILIDDLPLITTAVDSKSSKQLRPLCNYTNSSCKTSVIRIPLFIDVFRPASAQSFRQMPPSVSALIYISTSPSLSNSFLLFKTIDENNKSNSFQGG